MQGLPQDAGEAWRGCNEVISHKRFAHRNEPKNLETVLLAEAIDTAYHVSQHGTVLMAMPGITEPEYIRQIPATNQSSNAAMTLTVVQNALIDDGGYVISVKAGQMTGIFAWEPAFTELLRQYVIDTYEAKEPSLEEAIALAVQGELRVKSMKLCHAVFVADCHRWVKQVQMTPQLQMTPSHVDQAA